MIFHGLFCLPATPPHSLLKYVKSYALNLIHIAGSTMWQSGRYSPSHKHLIYAGENIDGNFLWRFIVTLPPTSKFTHFYVQTLISGLPLLFVQYVENPF